MKKQSGKKLVEILAVELKEWPEGFEDVGQAFEGCLHLPGIGDHIRHTRERYSLSSDWASAIVTRDQWEAERAKLEGEKVMRACVEKCEPESKPKANAQGWIRHKGRKMPVSACKVVEIRTRGGEFEVCRASGFNWAAEDEDQIMAYRLHQPEQAAEHVEVKAAEAEVTAPNDGPLQWRDRVTEIDRTVEALEEERASLIQKLADEGLQLLRDFAIKATESAGQPDMSDWCNWREGDLITLDCRRVSHPDFTPGKQYELVRVNESEGVVVIDDEGDENGYTVCSGMFKWHSRPTK